MGKESRIALVVDDERPLATLVSEYLTEEGFETHQAFDGITAVDLIRRLNPDVVILDLGLPGKDGTEVCREIRAFTDCYVIMLTARADEVDLLIGLSVGADDYLSKPFSPRELMARVRVLMRRPRLGTANADNVLDSTILTFGDLTIAPAAREVTVDGHACILTRIEFELLLTLARRPNMVFSRSTLIEQVWGDEWGGDPHLVDVHLLHLRKKLGDSAKAQRYIRTSRGVGYRMGTGT